jgi:hypothetical protein
MRSNQHFGPTHRLDSLYGIGLDHGLGETDETLRQSLLKQLHIPLVEWLKPHSNLFKSFTEDASTSETHRIISLGDLLRHPHPPLTYLRRAKDVAKLADARSEDPLPNSVASAIYSSTIAVALVKCSERITKKSDDQLREVFYWIANEHWIEESLRQVARAALELLGQSE